MGLLKEIINLFTGLKLPIIRGRMDMIWGCNGLHFCQITKLVANHGYLNHRQWFDIYLDRYEQLITLFDRLEKNPGMVRVSCVFPRNQVILG